MTKSTLALALLLMADPEKAPSAREPPVPPSLTVSALREELARARPVEPAGGEREKLTALLAELARAREAVRAETARLEALIRKATAAGLTDSPSPESQAAGQVELVSRALRGMAAEQAAAIVAHLERNLAVEVLIRLRPPEAGAILGLVKPELAAALATDMARRPPLPEAPRSRRKPEDLP